MRWNLEKKSPKPQEPVKEPKFGDRRHKLRFALLPRHCEDGILVWLEKYWSHQEYTFNVSEGPDWLEYEAWSR